MKSFSVTAFLLLAAVIILLTFALSEMVLVVQFLFLGSALVLTAVIALAFMVQLQHRGASAFFNGMLFGLAGIFVFLVLGMLKSVVIYDTPFTTDVFTATKGVLVTASVLLGFLLGGLLGIRPRRLGRLARGQLAPTRLLVCTLLVGLTGLVSVFQVESPFEAPRAGGLLKVFPPLLPVAGVLAIWLLFTLRPHTPARRLLFYVVLLPLPLVAMIHKSRMPLVFVASFALVTYLYRLWTRRGAGFPFGRVVVLGTAVMFLLAFAASLVDVFEFTQWSLEMPYTPYAPGSVWESTVELFTSVPGVDAFDNLIRSIELYPDREHYLYGWSVLGVVVNPIPRSLWSEKPYGFGRLLVEESGQGNMVGLSWSPSLAGELVANFGYLGPFLGYLVMGMVAASLYQRFLQARTYSPFHVLYLTALVIFVLESRGDLLSINVRIGLYLLYTYILLQICTVVPPAPIVARGRGCWLPPSGASRQ